MVGKKKHETHPNFVNLDGTLPMWISSVRMLDNETFPEFLNHTLANSKLIKITN